MKEYYTYEDVRNLVPHVMSMPELMKALGYTKSYNSNYITLVKAIKYMNLDISHWIFSDFNVDKAINPRKDISSMERESLLKTVDHSCEICGLKEWLGKKAILEIHHIDGLHYNNLRENLQVLCLQCHAQTSNYKARNKGKHLLKTGSPLPKKVKETKVKVEHKCASCLGPRSKDARICKGCLALEGPKRKFEISKEELEKLIEEMPMTEIAKKLGVSDNAVKKRARNLGIELIPRRGYWQKEQARLAEWANAADCSSVSKDS